jgi:hypothetical protein
VYARPGLAIASRIILEKVTSLMSKKFASMRPSLLRKRTASSLTCLITSYPHPKQFAIRALKRCSEKQHFSSNLKHPSSHTRMCFVVAIQRHKTGPKVKLSHGKEPRVWTAQRSRTSSKARAAVDPCSHCSLVPVASNKSDANSITKHQWEPLSWRLFNIARDWLSPTNPPRRVWAVLDELPSCRIPDEREVSLFERTSDWSFSILSHQNRKALLCALTHLIFFCFFHDMPDPIFCCRLLKNCSIFEEFLRFSAILYILFQKAFAIILFIIFWYKFFITLIMHFLRSSTDLL